jgi:hypothetical protein
MSTYSSVVLQQLEPMFFLIVQINRYKSENICVGRSPSQLVGSQPTFFNPISHS